MSSAPRPTITVLVSNDLTHDQRVKKVCASLQSFGFDIELTGRRLRGSLPMERPYPVKRFRLGFSSGALFYAALNVRLFFYLLFHRTDIILANDLDTLPAAWMAGRIRGRDIVYDSHEYFTEAAGLTGRAFQKRVWLWFEKRIFPKLQRVYTVNEIIAGEYRRKYGVDVHVIRNVPPRKAQPPVRSRAELDLPEGPLAILQGAFLDPDRGTWEAAQAMEYLPEIHLLIVGSGEEWEKVSAWKKAGNGANIILKPKLPFEELQAYTASADLGLSLDKPDHLNYRYSLPNKLFDYIQMQVPVLTSSLPELKRVHEKYEIGMLIDNHDPKHIADQMREALTSSRRAHWKTELERAAAEYHWEAEEHILREIYAGLLPGNV